MLLSVKDALQPGYAQQGPAFSGIPVLHVRLREVQPPLVRARVLGEDVEDQPGAVEHLHAQRVLERLLLLGAELVVGDEHGESGLALGRLQLLCLALAEVPVGVDVAALLPLGAHHLGAGCVSEVGQLGERLQVRENPAVNLGAVGETAGGVLREDLPQRGLVLVRPGSITAAFTPLPASSILSASVKASTANLVPL